MSDEHRRERPIPPEPTPPKPGPPQHPKRQEPSQPEKRPREPLDPETVLKLMIGGFALAHFVLGVWAMGDPGGFYSTLAPYAPQNDDFIRAMSSYPIAIGVSLFITVFKAQWRNPILFVAALGLVTSAIAALISINGTNDWQGYVNFIALLAAMAFSIWIIGYMRGVIAHVRKQESKAAAAETPQGERQPPGEGGETAPTRAAKKKPGLLRRFRR